MQNKAMPSNFVSSSSLCTFEQTRGRDRKLVLSLLGEELRACETLRRRAASRRPVGTKARNIGLAHYLSKEESNGLESR